MKKYEVSINPFAEYLEASETRRVKILKEQMNPDPVRIPWYQLAKAAIKLSVKKSGDYSPINEGITKLTQKRPDKAWKIADRTNSIEALKNFKGMILPEMITGNKLELVTTKLKYLTLYGIRIKMSPNLIFRITINGKKYIGAVKIHISKGKKFSNNQSKVVATLLNQFLSNCVAAEDEIVNPELCLCIDPFSKTTVNSYERIKYDMSTIKAICHEIPKVWDLAERAA